MIKKNQNLAKGNVKLSVGSAFLAIMLLFFSASLLVNHSADKGKGKLGLAIFIFIVACLLALKALEYLPKKKKVNNNNK
jgi:predicted Na+-dependent transporter